MMKTWSVNIAITLTLALVLTACGGSSAVRGGGSGGDGKSADTLGSGSETGTAGRNSAGGQPPMSAERPEKLRVYFEFDSSTIDSESRSIIEQHAAYLAAHPDIRINLTGHADERGTREYNLALGDRRDASVERMLQVLGISSDRITTISYGEERPLAMGHDETSWRVNRRVEFIYSTPVASRR
jgi:peptidoglycan-associated lipoprotein